MNLWTKPIRQACKADIRSLDALTLRFVVCANQRSGKVNDITKDMLEGMGLDLDTSLSAQATFGRRQFIKFSTIVEILQVSCKQCTKCARQVRDANACRLSHLCGRHNLGPLSAPSTIIRRYTLTGHGNERSQGHLSLIKNPGLGSCTSLFELRNFIVWIDFIDRRSCTVTRNSSP